MSGDLTPGDAAAIRADIRDLRTDVTSRMDQAVTRREHEAEVRRLDAEALATREALERHETSADRRLDALGHSVVDGDQKILAVIEADRAAHAAAEVTRLAQRKIDRHWLIGTMLVAAGVIIAAGQLLRVLF